jgi:Xaa-Pro dipeptidase
VTGPRIDGDRAGDYVTRLEGLRLLLDRRAEAAALLTTRRNFSWLTAGGIGHVLQSSQMSIAAILVSRDDALVITHNLEAARLVDEELADLGVEVVSVPWWEPRAIEAEALRRLPAGSRLADDADLEAELSQVRSVLSGLDRDRMADLGRSARAATDATLAAVKPGMTEAEVVAQLLGHLPGVRAPVVLAAADSRIARYRHPLPGHTPIRSRVMLVVVAERWGLHVAITRFRELEEPGADLARRIRAVETVHAAMHAATRPGATLGDVFAVAQSAYADVGFPEEWRDHHQGGSIGYQARERIAVPGDATPIESWMAFAWNPSIAGAKAEDTIVIVDGAARTVTG